MIEWLLWSLATALLLVTLPGTIELAVLTLGSLLPARKPVASSEREREVRLAVIVPVYNEEAGIARTIRSLQACDAPVAPADIIVQACNTTDRSVELARGLGCTVFERIDPSRRGKGYGLDYAFQRLADQHYTAYVIVDADTVVERNFLVEMRKLFARGAAAGQCVLSVANPGDNTRTRLMNIAFLAFTFLRPRARQRLGCSAGIFGNGFAITADTVRDVPYECFSIAEDLEYHTRLVRAGKKVEFLDGTAVSAEMCVTASQAKPQRERWEGGRLRIALDQAPAMALDILHGRTALLEPLLDLLLPPLAYHVVLLALLAAVGTGLSRAYAVVALALVAVHVLTAMLLGNAGPADWKALAMAPLYVVRRLLDVAGVLKAVRRSTPWHRTERAGT